MSKILFIIRIKYKEKLYNVYANKIKICMILHCKDNIII